MVKKNCPIKHEYVLECQLKNTEIVTFYKCLSYIDIKFPMFRLHIPHGMGGSTWKVYLNKKGS